MQGEIVSSDQQTTENALGDRLDDAIGETSSGIGALLSELVRRSLKSGVSDIGESLVSFAEEQVEVAVQQQMPAVAEAADEVAQSTSRRVVKEAVADLNESISSTRELAVEGSESSQRKIEELRGKARQTWLKLREEFTSFHDAHENLRKDHQHLVETLNQVDDQHRKEIAEVGDQHRKQIEVAEKRFSELMELNQRLEERIEILEQPRGIRGLVAKFRGRGKQAAKPDQIESDDDSLETPESDG